MGATTWDPSRGDREIYPSNQVGHDFRNNQGNWSGAGTPEETGTPFTHGGGGDFQIPESLQNAFNDVKKVLGSEIAQAMFSGLMGATRSVAPSALGYYMGQQGREDAKAMYDAQASLLNQQTQMLRDRHTAEEKPRANLLEAIASRMKQQAPSFLPDRPPPRRPYANVRRYDPRLTHQGRGDGYATRLSDALAYKWNPMGGR